MSYYYISIQVFAAFFLLQTDKNQSDKEPASPVDWLLRVQLYTAFLSLHVYNDQAGFHFQQRYIMLLQFLNSMLDCVRLLVLREPNDYCA